MLQPFVVSSTPAQGRPGSNPLRQFEQQRSELNDQLTSLTVQRDLLTQQLRNADEAGKRELQQQIALVGQRTTNVMKQLAAVDEAASKALADAKFSTAPAIAQGGGGGGGTAVTIIPPPISTEIRRSDERIAIFGIVGTVVVLVFALQRFRRPSSAGALNAPDTARLERLQQAVDVIAVEVERISEAQRYMSKIVGDGKALGAGPAEEIRVAAKERLKAP